MLMLQYINCRKKLFIPTLFFFLLQTNLLGQASSVNGEKVVKIRSSSQVSLTSKIDSYIKPYVEMKDFSGVVFIVKDNKIVFDKSYGKANYEMNSPINFDTRFRIGSVSKQFTAASILLLQERGKLSVGDALAKFIPEFPKGDKITLSMLLSHTGGISRDLPNEQGFLQVPRNSEELVEIIRQRPLIAEPGAKASYSNNGYRILAYVVEKVSGESLNDFLAENFFAPLGIKNTGQDSQLDLVSNRANGYVRWVGDSLGNAPFHDVSNDLGSGGLYSTAADLYKWDKALFEAKILKKSTLDLMVREDFGIGEKKTANHRTIGHDGRLTGFTSFNDYYPDDNAYVIFLSNIESGAVANIRRELPAILFSEPYAMPVKRPVEAKLDPNITEAYLGRYEVFPGFVLTLKRACGGLILGPAEGSFPLIAESATKFFYPLRYAEIEFVRDSGGVVTAMKWREFGSEYICKKIG